MKQVCFSRKPFYLIIVLITFGVALHIYQMYRANNPADENKEDFVAEEGTYTGSGPPSFYKRSTMRGPVLMDPVNTDPDIYDYVRYRRDNDYDRFTNPLRFPYKRYSYATPYINNYNNLYLPPEVIGCGSRRQPCMGGSQITIPTHQIPLDIGEMNIAPINVRSRGVEEDPQNVGVLYKIMGNENDVLPLFGRRIYPGSEKWEYYTMVGKDRNFKAYINCGRNEFELGTNDIVTIQGLKGTYRATIYDNDAPRYLPFF